MQETERLYEAIEEAARTKNPVRLKEGETLRTTMIDSTKFLVDDLFWRDGKGHIYQVVLEADLEKSGGFFLAGMYVFGNQSLEGFGSGRTTMFRKNNRYHKEEDVHEQDNIPNPFEDLTLEELYFLREHKNLLEKIDLSKRPQKEKQENWVYKALEERTAAFGGAWNLKGESD